eukprot:4398032-Amphidinium_carterae.1
MDSLFPVSNGSSGSAKGTILQRLLVRRFVLYEKVPLLDMFSTNLIPAFPCLEITIPPQVKTASCMLPQRLSVIEKYTNSLATHII